MADLDSQQMWEAFIGGWDDKPAVTQGTEIGTGRVRDFYNEIVGPAAGAQEYFGPKWVDPMSPEGYPQTTLQEQEGFGDLYQNYMTGFDTIGLQQAERQFKLAIGDPYAGGDDPFAWERVSRMTPQQADMQVQERLYEKGEQLGGKFGTEYEISTTKEYIFIRNSTNMTYTTS